MKKNVLIATIIIIVILVGAFMVISKKSPSYSNPETLDELKEAKASGGSEFDKCMEEANAREPLIEACRIEKLEEEGYSDGLDCIEDFNNPICEPTERYNADVNAMNDCREEIPETLTIFDCANLVGK